MHELYNDRPTEVEAWLETLEEREKDAFDKGYVIALCGLLEQFCESKRKIFTKLMELDEEDEDYESSKLELESRIVLLDIYERHYSYRVRNLVKRYNLQP